MTSESGKNDYNELVYSRCMEDFELFCTIFFAHYKTRPFCDMHRNQFNSYRYGEIGVKRVDAAPRGYAKSTIKALFRVVWDICYHQERYIIITSNTEDQSIQKIKDVRTELIENDLLIAVYGAFFSSNIISSKSFTTVNNGHKTYIEAAGSKKELRGRRFGTDRPTKIVVDDFEHSLEVESEIVRDKTKKIFYEVFARLGTKETNIEVVGTVLHRKSLLSDLLNNPGYERNVYKSIISWSKRDDLWDKWTGIYTNLDDKKHIIKAQKFYEKNTKQMLKGTKVLWPEHESYLDLMQEIIHYGRRTFFKEKQNSPISDEEKIFNPESIRKFVDFGDYLEICHNKVKIPKRDLIAYGAVDPATGQKKPNIGSRGDFTCLLTGFVDDMGRLFVYHDLTKRIPPSSYIKAMLDYHEEFNYRQFGVEINLFRNLLTTNIRDEEERRHETRHKKRRLKYRESRKAGRRERLPIVEIDQDENKEKRIYTIEPKVEHGWIYFNKSLSTEFLDQLYDFPKGDHDDAPDALEMLWSLTHHGYATGGLQGPQR